MENATLDAAHESSAKDHRLVEVTVNNRPVRLPRGEITGLEIKQAAIEQHVPIQLDFILQLELPNGNSRIIGDSDPVKVRPHERFTAIANDDNS